MTQPDDLALLDRVLHREEAALLALHERYARAVYSVAFRVLGERMAAEEVTQDTFMRLWDRGATFDAQRGRFLPWLLTIARRRAIDVLRQQQRRQPPEGAAFSLDAHPYLWEVLPEDDPARPDLRRTLIGVLDTLPEAQRVALDLAYFHGMSHGDIAAHLDLPLGTVKTRIRLGMQKLRDAWLGHPVPTTAGEHPADTKHPNDETVT